MTITYTGQVANARLCAFSRLLFYWKGSIYKLMYKEIVIFCALYSILSCIYRIILNDDQRRTFEKIALHCETFTNLIPLSFVLGFYVALVVSRWWNQYLCIPWPDRVMVYATTMIDGMDIQGRLIRRTLMRYLALGSLIVFQATSIRVKKRFPTMEHLIEAGIASRAEVQALENVNTPHGKWWIPFVWCCNLVKDARKHGRIADNYLLKSLIDEISAYRGSLGMLYAYDWISIPLVYTQVTTLSVYTFFLGCTFGRQFLDPSQKYPGHNVDLYIPFFTLLQFFFYMGWLKVAEQLINPFGEDDDDFEMNWIIDRNMQVSLLTTDDLYGQIPPIEKDMYFGEPPPDYLPYTKSSAKDISQPHMGSTAEMIISDEGMKVLTPLETIQEGVALGNLTRAPSFLNNSHRGTPTSMTNKASHYGNQNLMSGMRTPADFLSRSSLSSCGKDDVGQPNVPTTIVGKARDRLGRWLVDHSSRIDLNKSLHSTFTGIMSRQTSAIDEFEPDSLASSLRDHRGGFENRLGLSSLVASSLRLPMPTLTEIFHTGKEGGTSVGTNSLEANRNVPLIELQEHSSPYSRSYPRSHGSPSLNPDHQLQFGPSTPERRRISSPLEDQSNNKAFQLEDIRRLSCDLHNLNRDSTSIEIFGETRPFQVSPVRQSDSIINIPCTKTHSRSCGQNLFSDVGSASDGSTGNLFGYLELHEESSGREGQHSSDSVGQQQQVQPCSDQRDLQARRSTASSVDCLMQLPAVIISSPTKDRYSSSENSMEYEPPEQHQLTVSSMTPLLLLSTDEASDDGMDSKIN